MLGVLIPFGLWSVVPMANFIGLFGFIFIKYAVMVMTIRWWIKYGKIKTTDRDFSNARGTTIFVTAISILVIAIFRIHFLGLRI